MDTEERIALYARFRDAVALVARVFWPRARSTREDRRIGGGKDDGLPGEAKPTRPARGSRAASDSDRGTDCKTLLMGLGADALSVESMANQRARQDLHRSALGKCGNVPSDISSSVMHAKLAPDVLMTGKPAYLSQCSRSLTSCHYECWSSRLIYNVSIWGRLAKSDLIYRGSNFPQTQAKGKSPRFSTPRLHRTDSSPRAKRKGGPRKKQNGGGRAEAEIFVLGCFNKARQPVAPPRVQEVSKVCS